MEKAPNSMEETGVGTEDPLARVRRAQSLLAEHVNLMGAVSTAGELEILTRYVEKYPGGRSANKIADGFQDYVENLDAEPGSHATSRFSDFAASYLGDIEQELGEEKYQALVKGS
jgi:hypothetical protein